MEEARATILEADEPLLVEPDDMAEINSKKLEDEDEATPPSKPSNDSNTLLSHTMMEEEQARTLVADEPPLLEPDDMAEMNSKLEDEDEATPPSKPSNDSKTNAALHPMVSSLSQSDESRFFGFSFMADHPWPFLVILPIILSIIVACGWSKDDLIEESVERLWIADSGSYARDKDYAASLGLVASAATTFLGMAVTRDRTNLLNASRLEEVRTRMYETESTKIEHNGITYTLDDMCYQSPDPYKLPCLRISPMDLYKEAGWYFDGKRVAYYQTIRGALVAPLLPRYGILRSECTEACAFLLAYRTDPASVGYPDVEPDPLALFGDAATMEYSDPCKICIEDEYLAKIEELYNTAIEDFSHLQDQVLRARDALEDTAENQDQRIQLGDIADKLAQLNKTITKNDVNDFYSYYVARGMYGELGVEEYVKSYALSKDQIEQCVSFGNLIGLDCPVHPDEVNSTTASQHLLNHADNTFSSVNTFGAPTPFWSEADGTGALFKANNVTGTLLPVSGSGVNMSAPIESLSDYAGYIYLQRQLVDINSKQWKDLVEANPLYAWFMASVTPAKNETVCGNDDLPGTQTGSEGIDQLTAEALANFSLRSCTVYNVPNPLDLGTGGYSKQHFARMWYDLLFDSILGVVQGETDPYSWTTGAGCDYVQGGERYSYTNQTAQDILGNSSRLVYNIDEGVQLGPVDRHILLGSANPVIEEYDFDNPLQKVEAFQTLYPGLVAEDIVKRVNNCNRPGGAINITLDDAKSVLYKWKVAMQNAWNQGWDDANDGEVQFTCFVDDAGGALGSAGQVLTDMTLESSNLMIISIVAITVFSILFLFSLDPVESRALVTTFGVGLVVLSYFAGVSLGLLVGIKINLSIAWTLPFVLIGLGVDDIYIVLLSIKKQGGSSKGHWLKAMKEVAVPVTMTSLVNLSMFAIMNISDIPIIYLTSQVACFCVIALYLTALFCFPAYCYLDLKRQDAGRMDVIFCMKSKNPPAEKTEDFRNIYLYDKFYERIVLAPSAKTRYVIHVIIFLISAVAFVVGSWGITQRETGFKISNFIPDDYPAHEWTVLSDEQISGGPSSVNWGALNYSDPNTQMKMIKQFENLLDVRYIVDMDSKQLWLADFELWTSRLCTSNFGRENFDERKCGRDQMFEENSFCSGTWVNNEFGLREKLFQDLGDDTCQVVEGGICRPGNKMHMDDLREIGLNETSALGQSFCPVIQGWSDDKWKFCLRQWRNLTGAAYTFVLEKKEGSPTECSGVSNKDQELVWPLPYSSGPLIFAYDYYTQEKVLDFLKSTRAVCDDDDELHCWMSGNAFDYWSQYIDIFEVLMELALYATLAGFGISFLFLFGQLAYENHYSMRKILVGSFLGATLIGTIIILSLFTVIGICILADVNLTPFSTLSFVLSVGFSVEYSVHIVSRWLRAKMSYTSSLDRVEYTMSFLMIPTFMSFVSSTIGVICLAFTEFEFNKIFFFRPLMIIMFVSYWFGCWFLPAFLIYLDFDAVKLGKPSRVQRNELSQVQDDFTGAEVDKNSMNQTSTLRNSLDDNTSFSFSGERFAISQNSRVRDPPTGPTVLVHDPTVVVHA